LIPLAVPNLAGNEARYLQECVDSNFVSSVGPFVERFEAMVAQTSGASHAVATSSGTTGLHVALTAAGVGRDDLVVLPSLTFIASANAISYCGAVPWLFDVTADSWTLDVGSVARAFGVETERREDRLVHRASGRRVAAIMPVYTLGTSADMDPLVRLAHEYDLPVVADAAPALGARYRGRDVGSLGADLSVFSFNGNKTVTAGGGGAVTGENSDLCELVRHLTTTARIGADYTHDAVGFNYRMTNLQAAVGCAQLERLDELVAAKRRIARTYAEALGDLPGVERFPEPPWAESGCWYSGVTLTERSVTAAVAALQERGIGCRPFWKPIHLQVPYANAPCSELPVCNSVWKTILTLPCSTGLTTAEQDHVIEAVRTYLLSP
jgi:dTDP-4-amino-4,6-dideoxygalactose transaminase